MEKSLLQQGLLVNFPHGLERSVVELPGSNWLQLTPAESSWHYVENCPKLVREDSDVPGERPRPTSHMHVNDVGTPVAPAPLTWEDCNSIILPNPHHNRPIH